MKKNVKIIIIVVAIILCAGIGYFVYTNMENNNLSKLTAYNYEEDANYTKCSDMEGVEFSYPSNYQSIGNDEQPTYMDPDILGASVNLVSESTQGVNFENYIRLSKESLKKSLTVEGDITEEYINLNGVKAAKLDYTAVQSGTNIKLTQIIIIKSGKAYILTIGCLPDDAENMKEKTDKMIKSFR